VRRRAVLFSRGVRGGRATIEELIKAAQRYAPRTSPRRAGGRRSRTSTRAWPTWCLCRRRSGWASANSLDDQGLPEMQGAARHHPIDQARRVDHRSGEVDQRDVPDVPHECPLEPAVLAQLLAEQDRELVRGRIGGVRACHHP
jgi:hypothetical protein